MSHVLAAAALVAFSLALSSGCASDGSHPPKPSSPDFYFDQIRTVRDAQVLNVVEPGSLREAMPIKTRPTNVTWSTLAFTGTVSSVKPGPARIYTRADPGIEGDEEQGVREVAFDDPEADGRTVIITVRPDWTAGEKISDETFDIWVGTPGSRNPARFLDSLRGLTTIAGVLDRHDSGHYYPILQGGLLGVASPDGALEFPGIGEKADSFLGGVDSVEEFRAASLGQGMNPNDS